MPQFAKLNASNYPSWAGEMQAWLRSQGVWRIVSGQSKAPKLSSSPKDTEEAALDAWTTKSDKAAGYIYLAVEEDQKIPSPFPVTTTLWLCKTPRHRQHRPAQTPPDVRILRKVTTSIAYTQCLDSPKQGTIRPVVLAGRARHHHAAAHPPSHPLGAPLRPPPTQEQLEELGPHTEHSLA